MGHVSSSEMSLLLSDLGFERPVSDEIISNILAKTGHDDISNDYFLFECIKLLSQQNRELLKTINNIESYLRESNDT